MMDYVASLQSASQYLNIILGIIILIFGLIGNVLLAFIFKSRQVTFKQSPCSLYLFSMAIINTLHILHGLISRILSTGFKIDPTRTSLVYCKLRPFLATATLPHLSRTLQCAAIINQFLATSPQVRYRQKSTRTIARWCISISILFWALHGTPYLILYRIKRMPTTNTTQCDAFSTVMSKYTNWFLFNFLTFVIPGAILAIFSYLTLRNVRRLAYESGESHRRQQIERQMSSMLLSQIIFILIGFVPGGAMSVYTLLTGTLFKSLERKAIEFLLNSLAFLLMYVHFSSSFYLFYGVSSPFRKQCHRALQNLCCWSRSKYQQNRTHQRPTMTEMPTTV